MAEAIRKRREESGSIIRMEMYVSICFLEFLFLSSISFSIVFYILNFFSGGKCSGKASGQDQGERDSESTNSSFSA